jgi:hypothetical protein
MAYDEFRLELSPDLQTLGNWNVRILQCPVPGFVGPHGSIAPTIERKHLQRLRSQNGWPQLADLQDIGVRVWESMMNPAVAGAFNASVIQASNNGRKLRLTVVMVGQESSAVPAPKIRLQELPVEALFNNLHAFVATNGDTPVTRSLQPMPDAKPLKTTFPLRILVVVAAPVDKSTAKTAEEKQVLIDAFAGLTGPGGPVVLEFCEPPTRDELKARLAKPFHIIHFIGHGSFDIVGADETPRAYICLEDPDDRESDPIDAYTLETLLRGTGIRLAVIMACSTSQPAPTEEPYTPHAFDGVAQRLLGGVSGITSVVAMQFPVESNAAVEFSRSFYSNLIQPNKTLDELVTQARKDIVAKLNVGHRAWVTPTLYWRCEDGKVFELDPLVRELDEATAKKSVDLDAQLALYYRHLEDMAKQPADVRAALEPLRATWMQEIDALQAKRGELLGESLRLWGGSAKPGQTVDCRLTIRLRARASVGLTQVDVAYPVDRLRYVGSAAAQHSALAIPAVADRGDGTLGVVLPNVSQNQEWPPGEYAIGVLKFEVRGGVVDGLAELRLSNPQVARVGGIGKLATLDGIIFIGGQ